MSGILDLTGVALAALLSENFILVNCMGVGTRVESLYSPQDALRTGGCLTTVMVLSALCAWNINRFILVPMQLEYLRVLVLALLIPALVALLRKFLQTFVPELSNRVDGNMASISTNCAALGCTLLISQRSYGLAASLLFSLFGGLGATIALASFASLMLEVDVKHCPRCFRGYPIKFITAGLMALSLVGFYGLHLS